MHQTLHYLSLCKAEFDSTYNNILQKNYIKQFDFLKKFISCWLFWHFISTSSRKSFHASLNRHNSIMSNLLIKNLTPNSIIKLFYTLYYLSRCLVLRLSFPNFIRQFMFNCFLTQVRSLSLLKNFVFCANFYLKLKKCKYIENCRMFCCIKTSSSAIFIGLVKYLNIILGTLK